jgi:trk system potassium uptake protein TrkH
VLILVLRSVITGRQNVVFAGRTIQVESVRNAGALIFAAGMLACLGCLTLLFTETAPGRAVIFEVFSALGTVGLSQGITASLTWVGKLVVVVLMYAGRIGPLTLLLMFRPRYQSRLSYPAANVMIG